MSLSSLDRHWSRAETTMLRHLRTAYGALRCRRPPVGATLDPLVTREQHAADLMRSLLESAPPSRRRSGG